MDEIKDKIILAVKDAIANNAEAVNCDYDIIEIDCNDVDHIAEQVADTLIAANIGDVTEWKERAERMHKEALKQKQRVSDLKRSEDTMRNQLECAMGMVSEMKHAKRTLEILYVSGVIPEEALGEAVKQAKLEIEEENDDDR